ncbi:4-oxalocrotonate tautomerase family protein [Streptomyces sp. NPDC050560]|uniref:4-oxalocrotonate tautomerase family protein n=1 Tax=Streptomyces sp. NPDC050560 TaxID=3365630 RepID=UPI0037B14E6C
MVTVEWWKGNDRDLRALLVSELAQVVSRGAGCAPQDVTVVVRDREPGQDGDAESALGLTSPR